MKIGFLFPGQGAQTVGMGKDLYEKYDEAKNVYDEVKRITGIDIAKISFEGPEETLIQTKYTQLAILTMSLAIIAVLEKNNVKAEISAGLSLGEYSALIYSKILDFEDGIKLVQKRGAYMQDLVPEGEWMMAAILGMVDDKVIEVCNNVKAGFAVPVNFNCEGQVVVSGDKEGVEEAEKIAKEMGAKKVRVLKTSGPFHTEKLIDSSNALRKELDNIELKKFESKVAKNIDGLVYDENDDIRDILAKHIINPVKFSNCINTMLASGVDTFVEVGPGKTLTGFVKRTPNTENIKLVNINSVDSLEEFLNNK